MAIQPIGATNIEPQTVFLWNEDLSATIEVTELDVEDSEVQRFFVRTTKTFRLTKQDPESRENWHTSLQKINEYLKDTFSSFRLSVDYIDTVDNSLVDATRDADQFGEQAANLVAERQQIESGLEETRRKLQRIQSSITGSSEYFSNRLEQRHDELEADLEAVYEELEYLTERLQRKREELGLWKQSGVGLAYLLTVSTEAAFVGGDDIETALDSQTSEIRNEFYHSIYQVLEGSNFKLAFEELEEPRVFSRHEHTSLLNPVRLKDLKEKHPEYSDDLETLAEQSAAQYYSYATSDLELDTGKFEYAKATPAQAVSSILSQLEVGKVASGANAPNDGPMVGTVTGTQQVVGFDPADPDNGLTHLYIAGESGSGKSYLKRVILENVASLGYDILSITPSDKQSIGVSMPNPENDNSQCIAAKQYWLGDDRLLDEPQDVNDLFEGINVVTLEGLPESEKKEFVDRVFSALHRLENLDTPLYVFLEEAHNFDDGAVADAIQDIVREARKHGIHAVLVSQSPTDFSYSQKHVRENTSTVFMNGEYHSYADNFPYLEKGEIAELETGEAIFVSRDFPKTYVDVRLPLTLPEIPSDQQIDELDQKHSVHLPDLEEANKRQERQQPDEITDSTDSEETGAETKGELEAGKSPSRTVSDPDLEDEEQRLLRFIKQYIREEDQTPTYSKCHRDGPFGTDKTKKLLSTLAQRNKIEKESVVRGGQETEAYKTV